MASCRTGRPRLKLARRLISPVLSTTVTSSRSALALAPPCPSLASFRSTSRATAPGAFQKPQSAAMPRQQTRRYAGMRLPQAAATALAAVMPKTAGQIVQYGAARRMARACQEPAKYRVDPKALKDETIPTTENGEHIGVGGGVWHQSFPLLPTFSTWTSVSFLHLYLLYARIRAFDAEPEIISMLNKAMVDHFFWDAEERMDVHHGMRSGMIRQRFLKDLFEIWRGTIAAYDEGLAKGDAVLAAAVWRNLFKAREDVDISHLERVVAYMRCALSELDKMDDFDVQHGGEQAFAHATITELLGAGGEKAEAKKTRTLEQEGKKEKK